MEVHPRCFHSSSPPSSPMRRRRHHRYCGLVSLENDQTGEHTRHLQWHETNHTTPAKADTAQAEESIVEPVGSALDLGEDFGIVFRQSRRDGLPTLASFLAKGATETRCRDFLKIGVLPNSHCCVSHQTCIASSSKLTYLLTEVVSRRFSENPLPYCRS